MTVPEARPAPQSPTPAASAASVTPTVPPGFQLVPTLIGRPDSARHVWLPCPTTWCDQPHATERQVAVEDVWHSGPYVDLELPHRDGTELLAFFRLGLDPYSDDENKRRSFIFAEDADTANGYYLDPQHVEAMCDKAETAIARLRAMAKAVAST